MLAIEFGVANAVLGALEDVHSTMVLAAQSHVCYTAWCKVFCLLQLRMYRVVWFYQWCEYSSNIKLLWLTLFRNMSVSYCIFLGLYSCVLFYLQAADKVVRVSSVPCISLS